MQNLNSNPPLHNPKIEIFRERCWARALLWCSGCLDLHQAIDELETAAAEYGLVKEIGHDAVQKIMADAFEQRRIRT